MAKAIPAFIVVLAILMAVIWASDQVTLEGERTIYSVGCEGGVWEGMHCTGRLVPADRYRFRASRTRKEVMYWVVGSSEPSGIHRECVVKDRGNWKCTARPGEKPSVTYEMANNRPIATDPSGAPLRTVPKWKWWALRSGAPGFTDAG
jgi:hypothetical protein